MASFQQPVIDPLSSDVAFFRHLLRRKVTGNDHGNLCPIKRIDDGRDMLVHVLCVALDAKIVDGYQVQRCQLVNEIHLPVPDRADLIRKPREGRHAASVSLGNQFIYDARREEAFSSPDISVRKM